MLMSPTHPYVTLDQKIAVKSMRLLDDFMEAVKTSGYEQTRNMIAELHKAASAAVDKARIDGTGVTGANEVTSVEAFEGGVGVPEIAGAEDEDGEVWSMRSKGMGGVSFDPFVTNDGGASTWEDAGLWISRPNASA